MNKPHTPDKLERFAFVVSVAMAAGAAIYWIIQIKGVIAMLRLAYG